MNDNSSHHSNHEIFTAADSVFLKAQMQMLYDIMTQAKTERCVENCVKTENLHYITDLFHHSEMNLSCCFK